MYNIVAKGISQVCFFKGQYSILNKLLLKAWICFYATVTPENVTPNMITYFQNLICHNFDLNYLVLMDTWQDPWFTGIIPSNNMNSWSLHLLHKDVSFQIYPQETSKYRICSLIITGEKYIKVFLTSRCYNSLQINMIITHPFKPGASGWNTARFDIGIMKPN